MGHIHHGQQIKFIIATTDIRSIPRSELLQELMMYHNIHKAAF